MGWWMVFGAVVWLLFWFSIVWAILAVARGGRDGGDEDPVRIARKRLAQGEITPAEYEDVLRHLDVATPAH